jgi:hypothetical protein
MVLAMERTVALCVMFHRVIVVGGNGGGSHCPPNGDIGGYNYPPGGNGNGDGDDVCTPL